MTTEIQKNVSFLKSLCFTAPSIWQGYYRETWDFATELLEQLMSEHNDAFMHLLNKYLLAISYMSAIKLDGCVEYKLEKDLALVLKKLVQ